MLALLTAPSARPEVSGRYSLAVLPAAPERPRPAAVVHAQCCPVRPTAAPSDETVWVG